jgi:hypothetical protein
MLARYKRWQLGVVGWSARRKVIGFFGHFTGQASGSREISALQPHIVLRQRRLRRR